MGKNKQEKTGIFSQMIDLIYPLKEGIREAILHSWKLGFFHRNERNSPRMRRRPRGKPEEINTGIPHTHSGFRELNIIPPSPRFQAVHSDNASDPTINEAMINEPISEDAT